MSKNEHNPTNIFGANLGSYIEIDENKHQSNVEKFRDLCIYILAEVKGFKGATREFSSAEFRLENPFNDIIVMISIEDYYIRFDFQKKDNRISYFNKEKYDDYLTEKEWWILQVLLDNRDELLKSLFYKVRRYISFSNNVILDDELRMQSVLFTDKTFKSIVEEFLPKLGKILFYRGDIPVIYKKSFAITSRSFSLQQIRLKVVESTSNAYEFHIFYDSFLLIGRFDYSHCSREYCEYQIYDVYHTIDNKVLLYSYNEFGRKSIVKTNEGPQEYRLAAFLPLVKIYDTLMMHIEKKCSCHK